MSLGTFLAWASWLIVILNVSPLEAAAAGFLMFYLTLAMALVGSVALVGSFVRLVVLRRREVPSREIRIAFRHAVLFAAVAVATLMLSVGGWLRIWHVIALVAVASLAEAVFLQMRSGRG